MRVKGILFGLVALVLINSAVVVGGVPIILLHPEESPEILPIRAQRVNIEINNGYVVTNVSQEFYNPHDYAVQGNYMFALPEEAFISNFSLTISGIKHYGAILPREQAREEYLEAVDAGRTAALLEYVGRKMFTYAVSLAPLGFIEIDLVYEQFLTKRFNSYTYLHPLETKEFDTRLESLIMTIDIHSKNPVSNIHIEEYEFSTLENLETHVRLQYAREDVIPETDLILTYDVAAYPDEGSLFVSNREGIDYFMYVFAPVIKEASASALPKDVIFVIDKSGSMAGEKMEQTKAAMQSILPQLNPNDRFTMVFYDSIIRSYAPNLLPVTTANIEAALVYVDSIKESGQTNINQALLTALEAFPDSNRPKLLIFLTDGLPTAGITGTSEIVENIVVANTVKGVKLYSFGFGWDVDMALLHQLSNSNQGAATRIHPSQAIDEQLSGFFQTIAVPLLKDISIDFGGPVEDVFPPAFSILFNGSEAIIVGMYYGDNPMSITVTTESVEGPQLYLGTFDLTDPALLAPFVPKLWAIHKINALLDQIFLEGETPSLIHEITQLSVEYGLVTPYTSILIDPDALQGEISQEEVLDAEALQTVGITTPATSGAPPITTNPTVIPTPPPSGEPGEYLFSSRMVSGRRSSESRFGALLAALVSAILLWLLAKRMLTRRLKNLDIRYDRAILMLFNDGKRFLIDTRELIRKKYQAR